MDQPSSDLPPNVDDDPPESWFWEWPDEDSPTVRQRLMDWWMGR